MKLERELENRGTCYLFFLPSEECGLGVAQLVGDQRLAAENSDRGAIGGVRNMRKEGRDGGKDLHVEERKKLRMNHNGNSLLVCLILIVFYKICHNITVSTHISGLDIGV